MSRMSLSFCMAAVVAGALSPTPALAGDVKKASGTAIVEVFADRDIRTMDRRLLVGDNIAAWWGPERYEDKDVRAWTRELGPTLIRLPGGSWGDELWWNGNGVRKTPGNELDMSRFSSTPWSSWSAPFGVWKVDYSAYAPGFKASHGNKFDKWHGHTDVKYLHDWTAGVGSEAFVIVNAGQGTPRDAAEWVRWAAKSGYKVRYWEIGNELGGSWESGNQLPDGSRLNGEIYSRRYEEFATAMKAVDPAIKVGCMDWMEDVLKRCGPLVDFLSIHTYPVNGAETTEELFAKTATVEREVSPVRELIRKYQPDRAGKIEIGYSEWNLHFPDTRGALMHALWLGEMFRNGVAFSTHFQLFDTILQGAPTIRTPAWFAFWLWRHAMGDTLVESRVGNSGAVTAYATRTDEGLAVMLANRDDEKPTRVTVSLKGFEAGAEGEILTFSRREYLWLDRNHDAPGWEKPRTVEWSTGFGIRKVVVGGRSVTVALPPASLAVLRLPRTKGTLAALGTPSLVEPAAPAPRLEIWVPSATTYADTPVEGWVLAYNGAARTPWPGALADATLKITGPAKADRRTVRLAESAGRFLITASRPGTVGVEVRAAGQVARATLDFVASVPRPVVFWEFEDETPTGVRSQWKLTSDPGIRPNQRVLRVELEGDNPSASKKRELVVIDRFPGREKLKKENIRGAFFDIRTGDVFRCTDPKVRVTVVMQSPKNWWMVLGSAPLTDAGKWKTVTVPLTKPEHVKAVSDTGTILILLEANQPVFGSIYIDRAGLLVR
ncbi:MAG: hypothetical protein AAB152_03680 [Candidatus Coatesbacteria bacterium]